jgi:hypothetical protein
MWISNFHVKYGKPRSNKIRGADFVRACAVEMHMDMSQQPFYAKIYKKNAGKRPQTVRGRRLEI